ncbi:Alkaline-phosphatase-like, core domain protein, partial [Metarhizium majus ARSEF 297]
MDLCASPPFEARRNTSPPRTGRRPLKSYICRLPEELYDLEADPKGGHNLAGTLEYDSVVKQMREEVEKWQMETKDLVAAERWYFSAAIQGV